MQPLTLKKIQKKGASKRPQLYAPTTKTTPEQKKKNRLRKPGTLSRWQKCTADGCDPGGNLQKRVAKPAKRVAHTSVNWRKLLKSWR